jgi:hypothetical protein
MLPSASSRLLFVKVTVSVAPVAPTTELLEDMETVVIVPPVNPEIVPVVYWA